MSLYILQILHSTGLEFIKELDTAADLDQIIEIHAAYVRKIHERCLLHRRNMFLKEAIMKVLNIILLFQSKWDQGIDLIRYGTICYMSYHAECIRSIGRVLD